MRTVTAMLRGGENGPAVVARSAAESLLLDRLRKGEMPPDGKDPLTAQEVELLTNWIQAGLPADEAVAAVPTAVTEQDRAHWAFRKLNRPAVPSVRRTDDVATRVDAFVLARLQERGLSFAAPADRLALLRRASLDLIGLPPTPDEQQAFASKEDPGAFERLVDRLLASPHFGERWGRHWLDVAGYVDICGLDNDAGIIYPADGKWRYRDYVIDSLNRDKPYDRFVMEQLAGDELAGDWRGAASYSPETLELLIATGYLRSVSDSTFADELNTPDLRHHILFDAQELIGTGLLGLTMQCARCHSHKYEPIPQRDYYRMLAAFTPSYNPEHWLQPQPQPGTTSKPPYRELIDVSAAEKDAIDRHNAEVDRQVSAHQPSIDALAKRNESLSNDERQKLEQLQRQVAELKASRKSYGHIQALYDVGPLPVTRILRRGDYLHPAGPVEPRFLSVLDDPALPAADVSDISPPARSSGRRLALACWLTDPRRPSGSLLARVMVNRIWMHLFGRGIVPTPGNFGRSGSPPSHPELLEWLAAEFVENGWRVKPLVRQIMLSKVYQQTSAPSPEHAAKAEAADPDNVLLWRMPLRRLESETVRDALLAASGELNRSLGGPPTMIAAQPDGMVLVADKLPQSAAAAQRRSVYLLARRNYNLSVLDAFDQPVMTLNCTERQPAAPVTQTLTMLNDAFVARQAEAMSAAVAAAAGPDREQRVSLAFHRVLGRPPSASELGWAVEFLKRQEMRLAPTAASPDAVALTALARVCHVLLNTSEFLYVP